MTLKLYVALQILRPLEIIFGITDTLKITVVEFIVQLFEVFCV
jgi:hypothetical protein